MRVIWHILIHSSISSIVLYSCRCLALMRLKGISYWNITLISSYLCSRLVYIKEQCSSFRLQNKCNKSLEVFNSSSTEQWESRQGRCSYLKPLLEDQQLAFCELYCLLFLYCFIFSFPEMQYFQQENVRKILTDVLFCYARENEQLLYKQVMKILYRWHSLTQHFLYGLTIM